MSTITNRPLADNQDYWRVHNLLIQTYPITPFGFNWEIRRFHDDNPEQLGPWSQNIQLWETETGDLVTVVHREGHGDAHLQLHPDYRHLELDMFTWAEKNLSKPAKDGIPYDEVNKPGIFEPVCTHSDHQRKGLGKALMQEGLLRLKAISAIDVLVGTGDMISANRLYDSLGFTEAYKGFVWQKVF